MAYNDNNIDYWKKNLKADALPVTLLRLADAYKHKLDELGPELRETIEFILENFLVEGNETVSLTGGDGTAIGGTNASPGQVVGTIDVSLGVDWTSAPETLMIDSTSVDLDTATNSVTTTVTEINDALGVAGINTVEAFEAGNNVGLRTTSSGSGESFDVGTSDGASTLGIQTGTYVGTDAVTASETEFAPNFGNVGISESYFVVTVDGSIVQSRVSNLSPLRIRVSGDVTGASTVSVEAINPTTFEEYFGGSKPLIDSTN